MAAIKLKPGETVVVAAVDPSLYPDQGLPTPQPPTEPVDPGYGIDLGLGYLRPTHPIVLPPPTVPIEPPPEGPVDPGWGIDDDHGYLRPTHPIVLPPPGVPTHPIVLPPEGPVDPGWGIDEDIGYVRPDNSLPIPQPPTGGVKPDVQWDIKTAWTPVTGWIVVAVPTGEVATPS